MVAFSRSGIPSRPPPTPLENWLVGSYVLYGPMGEPTSIPVPTTLQVPVAKPVQLGASNWLMRGVRPLCPRIVATGVPGRSASKAASYRGVSTYPASYVELLDRAP